MQLEIAVFNVDDAIKAAALKPQRLEICSKYQVGGITCHENDLKKIRTLIDIPIFAIVRPRDGNFVYNDEEFAEMKKTISLCKELHYNGIVLGILNADNTIDEPRTAELVTLANPLPVTFHRAFDKVPNFEIALEIVIKTGCKRILTSGGKSTAVEGIPTIEQLIEKATSRISILPGGGIRSQHLHTFLTQSKATEFHSAALDNLGKLNVDEIIKMKKILEQTKSPHR
jgi:copper homeostasis protein